MIYRNRYGTRQEHVLISLEKKTGKQNNNDFATKKDA